MIRRTRRSRRAQQPINVKTPVNAKKAGKKQHHQIRSRRVRTAPTRVASRRQHARAKRHWIPIHSVANGQETQGP